MKKKTVAFIGLLIISLILITGCVGEPRVQYKQGLLTDVVEGNLLRVYLIFDDGSVLEGYAEYDAPYFKDFIDERVEIRYFDDWGITILDIKEIGGQ